MIDVSVDIFGIVMHCNESILGLKIGSDYSFEKIYLDMLPHKDRITNSRGDLNVEYADSCLVDENGKLCGDVDFPSIEPLASMATPVPGGVGAVTTAVLAKHLVLAGRRQRGN